jgi:hypothetical protein
MKDDVFVTADGVGGHLEFIGQPLNVDGSVHCWRREVRETLAGFEVHDVRFMKFRGYWREAYRDKNDVYESKAEAIQAVKQHEKGWWEAVADDLEEQRDRERIEAGWELGREPGRGRATRDIVDMVYDDGLTPKEGLELERQHRVELAREFRDAADALQSALIQETTCDWCGVHVQTVNDHKIVDGQPMCLPCVKEYGWEEGKDYER